MLPTDREQDPRDSGSGSTTIRRGQNRALPIAGYLFKEKVDVNDIIDPVDMGLKVLQARRKGGIEKFYSPERYQLQIKELMTSVNEKKESRTQTDLQMWGDDITNSDTWPKVKKSGHIRCLFYNVNGISHRQNYFEMDMAMQMMSQVQADILMISEVNLNMFKPRVRARLKNLSMLLINTPRLRWPSHRRSRTQLLTSIWVAL